MQNKLLRVADGVVLWLSILLFGLLTAASMLSTAYFTPDSSYGERPEYRWDVIPLNLLFLAAVAGILYILYKKQIFKKISMKMLAAIAVLFVIGMSVLWIQASHTYPEADQKAVSWVSYLMTQNNFLFFEHGKYMQIYPNQLGLTAILEVLYRLTGGENWKAFMYLTALANGVMVYLLYRITDRLYHDQNADCLVLLASMGCIQIILYSTFLYGMMLGLAFALGAFYTLLLFLDHGKWRYAVNAGILMGISILVKNNYSIFLVALVILLLYDAVKKSGGTIKKEQMEQTAHRQPMLKTEENKLGTAQKENEKSGMRKAGKSFAAILIILGMTVILSKSLTAFYEHRSGIPIESGMPKSLWVAMGMQEGERAEGWYNGFNFDTYVNSDCDPVVSDAIAREAITESLQHFQKDPVYAARFYLRKTLSQWNEPTYEALWVNQFHSGDFSTIVQSIYEGKLYRVLSEYMNLFQLLVFAAVFAGLLIDRKGEKRWQLTELFLPMVILGGFFFHTIWEAKSQYIFPYFVCMLPGAAAGLSGVLGKWNSENMGK